MDDILGGCVFAICFVSILILSFLPFSFSFWLISLFCNNYFVISRNVLARTSRLRAKLTVTYVTWFISILTAWIFRLSFPTVYTNKQTKKSTEIENITLSNTHTKKVTRCSIREIENDERSTRPYTNYYGRKSRWIMRPSASKPSIMHREDPPPLLDSSFILVFSSISTWIVFQNCTVRYKLEMATQRIKKDWERDNTM